MSKSWLKSAKSTAFFLALSLPVSCSDGDGQSHCNDNCGVLPQSDSSHLREFLNGKSCDGCNLTNVTSHGGKYQNLSFTDTNFSGCDLQGSSFQNSNLNGANFSSIMPDPNSNLREVDFSSANLSSSKFLGADLTSAKLNKADLSGADLSGANLSHADLSEAKLDGATFCNTTMPDGEKNNSNCP